MSKLLVSAVALATALALGPGVADAAPSTAGPPTRADAATPTHTVTLITGDRLRVGGGDSPTITVERTPGREHTQFRTSRVGDQHLVIPLDAMPLIEAGRLDQRLFDVAALIEYGYTDDRRDSVPVIITYERGATAKTTPGVTVSRALTSVTSAAATIGKADAATTWHGMATAAGVDKVWLDGLRRPSLEQSVPQIGAPAAHDAGFTGTGTTVAVLDTGVDDTHADLAGRVVASRNFTEEPDGDLVGHGTHVASTVAGTGVASDGRLRGVAFGASILSGKVCEVFGCPESSILAGMEWAAAEQGADVVNMSLGGPDGPGLDLLEEAVERLTADHGTLFVIAAGNAGSEGSVGSPSTADAALAVGAVDRQDRLAAFSSRGPRLDGAIKPEVTAPGVDIVAARAGTTDGYFAASGTSMATPHVAGAAALLAQRHPDWTPAQLKAALVGTAVPADGGGVYEQGGGRIDVGVAIDQALLAQPATVSLGRPLWPHQDDEPVRSTTTIHNTGTTDVTLTLELHATGPGGIAPPAGMFTLDATEVTVPAGGTADLGVTADTGTGGPDGLYGGWLTASAGGTTALRIPIAVDQEVESYDVTVARLGFDGATSPGFVTIVDPATFRFFDAEITDGPVVVRVPKGRYLMESAFFDDPDRIAQIVQPLLEITGPTSLTLDARQARPVRVTVPSSAVENVLMTPGFTLASGDFGLSFGMFVVGPTRLGLAHLGPRDVEGFNAFLGTHWAVPGDDHFGDSPELYLTFDIESGSYFDGFDRRYRARDFARVRSEHHAQEPGRMAFRGTSPRPVEFAAPAIGLGLPYTLPSTRTEYLAGEDVVWGSLFVQEHPELGGERELGFDSREYRAGRSYTERWNQPMFGPTLPGPGWVGRFEDVIAVFPPLYGDGGGHYGFAYTGTGRTTLYRDGVKVGELLQPGPADFLVPPEPADYRLEVEAQPGTALSSRVSAAWTFRSQHVGEFRFETAPVTAVRFWPKLDDAGSARGGRPMLVPVGVERQDLPASDVRGMTVEASYDDGATWRRVPLLGPGGHSAGSAAGSAADPAAELDAEQLGSGVGARWIAVLDHPRGPGHVSLRATGTDRHGNTFEQTIIRAYRLR